MNWRTLSREMSGRESAPRPKAAPEIRASEPSATRSRMCARPQFQRNARSRPLMPGRSPNGPNNVAAMLAPLSARGWPRRAGSRYCSMRSGQIRTSWPAARARARFQAGASSPASRRAWISSASWPGKAARTWSRLASSRSGAVSRASLARAAGRFG